MVSRSSESAVLLLQTVFNRLSNNVVLHLNICVIWTAAFTKRITGAQRVKYCRESCCDACPSESVQIIMIIIIIMYLMKAYLLCETDEWQTSKILVNIKMLWVWIVH